MTMITLQKDGGDGLLVEFWDKLTELIKADSLGIRSVNGMKVCFYCGKPLNWGTRELRFDTAVKEHVLPKILGGTGHKGNLVWACHECNASKGTKHPLLWLAESSLSVPDEIIFDVIIRVLLAYLRIVNSIDIMQREENLLTLAQMHEQEEKLLALAHSIIETLGEDKE